MNRTIIFCIVGLLVTGCASNLESTETLNTAETVVRTELATQLLPTVELQTHAQPTRQAASPDDELPTLVPSASPTPTNRPPSPTPTPTPTLLSLPTPYTSIPSDWLLYRNSDYGFSFQYPPSWSLKETEAHEQSGEKYGPYLELSREDVTLTVAYKRADDPDTIIGCTGTAQGDFVDGGEMIFLDQHLPLIRLVYQNKLNTVFFERPCGEFTRGNLAFSINLYDHNPSFDEVNIPPDLINETIQILATFKLL